MEFADKSGESPKTQFRMRPRDLDRMRRKSEKWAETHPDWTVDWDVQKMYEEALARTGPRRPKPKRDAMPDVKSLFLDPRRSTKQTPLNEEVMFKGSAIGSRPSNSKTGQNFDYSGFAAVIDHSYNVAASYNARLPRELPFAMYQHAMVELLNATILTYQRDINCDPLLINTKEALTAIKTENINIPEVILDYLCRIGNATSPTGKLIKLNMPTILIPKGPIAASGSNTTLGSAASSGSFGPPDEFNHNAYECYFAPYVSRRLIERTASQTLAAGDWNPFPNDWVTHVNMNCLGYQRPLKCAPDTVALLQQRTLEDSDTVTGRLSHCPFALERVSY